MGVDSVQWPIINVVNTSNHWLDTLTGYAIAADKRFQWDNTNHTKLPEGTTPSVAGQSDYSFLTDEQGNTIITLTGISRLDSASGNYIPLSLVDRNDPNTDLTTFGTGTGIPTEYDKIADNIIRLNLKPASTVAAYLKFYFQRTSSYYTASSTTKTSGFSPLLDNGFVVNSAYVGALTLGLQNLQALGIERQVEEKKMMQYFADRNRDDVSRMSPARENNR